VRFLDATRERFLQAIAAQLPAERWIELHCFQPIRQGGVESGVAVVAAHPERPPAPPILADAPAAEDDLDAQGELAVFAAPNEDELPAAERYTVYTATYRLVLKGPERGKWEATVVAEADAPLVTVSTVVRGVMRRSGDADEPTLLSGEEARTHLFPPHRKVEPTGAGTD
jgi:hypothetical protein